MTCIFTTVVLADTTGAYEQLSKSMFHSSVGLGLFDVVKRFDPSAMIHDIMFLCTVTVKLEG